VSNFSSPVNIAERRLARARLQQASVNLSISAEVICLFIWVDLYWISTSEYFLDILMINYTYGYFLHI